MSTYSVDDAAWGAFLDTHPELELEADRTRTWEEINADLAAITARLRGQHARYLPIAEEQRRTKHECRRHRG